MRRYEALLIFPPDSASGGSKDEEKRLEELIRRLGGRLLDRTDLGRRPLGYPLRKSREGRLLQCLFEMEPNQIVEFQKVLELDETILKSTVLKSPVPKTTEKDQKKSKPFPEGPQEKQEALHGRKS